MQPGPHSPCRLPWGAALYSANAATTPAAALSRIIYGVSGEGSGHSSRAREMLTHLEAYRLRPDIEAVVHAHPPTAVALSIAGISLARCLLPEVVLAFCMIPTADYATPSSADGAEVIRELITSSSPRRSKSSTPS